MDDYQETEIDTIDLSPLADLKFQSGSSDEDSNTKGKTWSWKRKARRLARRLAEAGGTPPAEERSQRDTSKESSRGFEAENTHQTRE